MKVLLYFILFLFIFHIGLHIYYMSVGVDGHWYNKYGRVVYFNQYKPYGISEFGGRLRTSSNLQSDDIEYWYRCPFKTIPIRLFSNY